MQVLLARATRRPSSSTTSHSIRPTLRPAWTNPTGGRQTTAPHRTQKVDLQLQCREGRVGVERRGVRHAHGGVRQAAQNATVECAHRVGVPGQVHFEVKHRPARLDLDQAHADGFGHRDGRGLATAEPGQQISNRRAQLARGAQFGH
ncbi:MAG TPA: hypothetical protein VKV73_30680 [Chloroflexota bacterium]|nr:hypothetical protein [Chloroflexota bacterium]